MHAGKVVIVAWGFIPIDVGQREGIFAKYRVNGDTTNFGGDAKLQKGRSPRAALISVSATARPCLLPPKVRRPWRLRPMPAPRATF